MYRFARDDDDFVGEGDAHSAVGLQQLEYFRRQLNRLERGRPPEMPRFSQLAEVIADVDWRSTVAVSAGGVLARARV
jgi:hypothetical protein